MTHEDFPERFPLAWPANIQRTKRGQRKRAPFGKVKRTRSEYSGHVWKQKGAISMHDATRRLLQQLDLVKAKYPVLSTNLELRLDGLPRSGQRRPDDPGAALYFLLEGRPHCMTCDRWDRVEDNVCALAKHIEALRGIARWGVGSIEQAFAGYAGLPAPGADWRAVFRQLTGSVPGDVDEAKSLHRETMRVRHPDKPGGMSSEEASRLNVALDAVATELSDG